jgi:hypothetical protein
MPEFFNLEEFLQTKKIGARLTNIPSARWEFSFQIVEFCLIGFRSTGPFHTFFLPFFISVSIFGGLFLDENFFATTTTPK